MENEEDSRNIEEAEEEELEKEEAEEVVEEEPTPVKISPKRKYIIQKKIKPPPKDGNPIT
jgi:hypothetical protein